MRAARSPRSSEKEPTAPQRAALFSALPIPGIAFIQGLAILLTKPPIFGLKILLLMVSFLFANVLPHTRDMYRADTEFSITRLPRGLCFATAQAITLRAFSPKTAPAERSGAA
jgi:hypothetical protein